MRVRKPSPTPALAGQVALFPAVCICGAEFRRSVSVGRPQLTCSPECARRRRLELSNERRRQRKGVVR